MIVLTTDAIVAGTLSHLVFDWSFSLHLHLFGLAWRTRLSDAVDDDAVANEALEQPVVDAIASDTGIDACLTEIEITLLADAAVVVLVWNRLATIVAVDAECTSRKVLERWNRRLTQMRGSWSWAGWWVDVRIAIVESTRNSTGRLCSTAGLLKGLE